MLLLLSEQRNHLKTFKERNHERISYLSRNITRLTQLKAGQLLKYNAKAIDPDADPVSYSLVLAPKGMTVDAETGTVIWNPTKSDIDEYYAQLEADRQRLGAVRATAIAKTPIFNVLVRAQDGKGGQALQYIKVELISDNQAPVFTSIFPSTSPQANKAFQYQAKAIDPNNDTVIFSLVSAPLGASIDGSTGLITWQPTSNQIGETTFTIKASDGKGGESLQTGNLNVIAAVPNRIPVVSSTPRTSVRYGNSYSYEIAASDDDGDRLTYSLVTAPSGMTLNNNILNWTPNGSQFGDNNVSIKVTDAQGGSTLQSFAIRVGSQAINNAPTIASAPNLVTTIDREYVYDLSGSDANGDRLFWSLEKAPTGMVIEAATGRLRWQPTASQIGNQAIAIRVTDSYGGYSIQEFTLKVNAINSAPNILSTPITKAGQGQLYTYDVVATDVENDGIRYSLISAPTGMTIDADTGHIAWTPSLSTTGSYNVQVQATDSRGVFNTQTYKLEVIAKSSAANPINHAPIISSQPKFLADTNSRYEYQVSASDPDVGDRLTYQLLSNGGATGIAIDSSTGLVTWNSPNAGTYRVVIGAVDEGGLGAAQGFTLTARANQLPIISSDPPPTRAVPNVAYVYDVKASDPDGGRLQYRLDPTSLALGITMDELGRLRWTPTASQVGNHPVTIAITDESGGVSTQNFSINVQADTSAPTVKLTYAGLIPAEKGSTITFQVQATDDVKVADLQLLVDGEAVVLDPNGLATVVLNKLGNIQIIARAIDLAGNVGQDTSVSIPVYDPTAPANAPEVSFDLTGLSDNVIRSFADIKGSVTDPDNNLLSYVVDVAPVGTEDWTTIFTGNREVNAGGVLGKFDPSIIADDSYRIRLTATDTSGLSSAIEDLVDVSSQGLKLGNFTLSFTDLSIPIAGIPINVTRTYDSLNARTKDDFGYGWRLEFRDTDLRTSLGKDEVYEELGYRTLAFKEGTKVFITLPGGKRETFTFQPKQVRQIDGLPLGMFASYFYTPEFVSEKGSTNKLSVQQAYITPGNGSNKFYGFQGSPYNPADVIFGNRYFLTTKEGIVYEIDASTGDLVTVSNPNGNKLSFSDAGITASTSLSTGSDTVSIAFARDAQGKITTVTDPLGQVVQYQYDAKGDLVGVTDRENNTTLFKYAQPSRDHFLTEVVDPLGRSGVKNEYDAQGRLKYIYDVNGNPVEMAYDPNTSKQTVTDARGYSTTYIYDNRGNVLTEIDAKGGVTTRTYDDDNNLLSETDADGVTNTYTYDANRNLLTSTDGDGNTTRMTYDGSGRVTSVVSPTGLSTNAKYDSRGNLVESIDTDGLKTTYIYNARGQLRFQTAPDGQVTEYNYDQYGNPNVMVDSRGNKVEANYDLNGRMSSATTTFNLNGQTYTLGTEYDYDENGRTIASRTSRGTSQSMTYDALGRVKSMTDEFGNVTSFNYDLQGTLSGNTASTIGSVVTRIDEIIQPDNTPNNSGDNPKIIRKYDQNNNLIAEISPTGLETRYVYDELGRLIETIAPDTTPDNWNDNPRLKTSYSLGSRVKTQSDIFGNDQKYFYNNIGQLINYQDVLGNATTYTYNEGGQIETATDPRNRLTRYVYDDKARVTEVIYFDNSSYKLTYDELGRVKTETNELNQTTTYEYDAYGQVKAVISADLSRTEFEYDRRRNLVKVTDALGRSTNYKYDQYGQQVETQFANSDKVLRNYDQFGRVTQVTDENSYSTNYSYNNLSQLTEIIQANQAKTTYTYDNLARLTAVTDANQNVTNYEYDAFYRQTATILPMGQRNLTVYDKFGQTVKTTDFNGDSINYAYDAIGRLANKTFTDSRVVSYTYDAVTSQLKTVTDGRGVTSYSYDQRDRLKTMLTPDQKSVTYGYDLLDNVTSLTTQASTTNYSYDSLNRLDKVKDGTRLLADYDYDFVGNLSQIKLADGSVESRQYDVRNRLTQITTKNVTGTVFSGFSYTLDGVGNRTQVVENNGRTVDYFYDVVNRLTQEKITDAAVGDRTIGYNYDLVSNRLSKTDTLEGLTTYAYDANNRLTNTTAGTKVTNFSYDNNGSLKLRSDGTKSTVYDWINDGENRLIGVNTNNAGITSQSSFVYDAFGNRVSSTTDGVKTNYLAASIWDLPEVLMEYDDNDNILTDYTQGIGLVRSRHDGLEGFYHTDALGSTRVVTDNVGLITDRYTYDAFGVLLDQSGTFGNSSQFAGEQRDSATGLDYLRARYYDPLLGRFVSKDAFGGVIERPMSQNSYLYADANPVNNTDPSGYFTMGDVSATLSVLSTLAASGGVGFGVGYIGAAAATGASGEQILGLFGEWGAGFASGVSGGLLTDIYEAASGKKIEPKHSALFNAGNITGIGVSFLGGNMG
ncbi:MAG: putative Ig domain-containing protein [Pseudanabaena sp. ELA645]